MGPREQFIYEILSLSKADRWPAAAQEWNLGQVFLQGGGTCICGKHPIVEQCVMHNKKNGASAIVGNECVKKFFEMNHDSAFRAMKKLKGPDAYITGSHIVSAAVSDGALTEFEADWYCNMRRYLKQLYPGSKARILRINGLLANYLEKHPGAAKKPVYRNHYAL